jgi:hypothetical protein
MYWLKKSQNGSEHKETEEVPVETFAIFHTIGLGRLAKVDSDERGKARLTLSGSK